MATKGRGITIKPATLASPAVTICQHHWVLEAPNGPTIPGWCKRCGETGVWPASGTLNDPLSREAYDRRRAR